VKGLLVEGRSPSLENFVSKRGNKFAAHDAQQQIVMLSEVETSLFSEKFSARPRRMAESVIPDTRGARTLPG
jgi:hypothetical protein